MSYDVIVIGAGPGGYSSAIRLSQLGKRVALIEKDRVGGECLNYACIPTKALIQLAKTIDSIEKFKGRGLRVKGVELIYGEFCEWREKLISRLRAGIEYLCKKRGIDLIQGFGRIVESNEVEVVDGGVRRRISAEEIIIATGSKPRSLPGVRFGGRILNSRMILALKNPPKSMVIIGGGAIGVELASAYSTLGTEITIIELMDQLLPGFSRDLSLLIRRRLEEKGVKVYLKSKTLKLVEENGRVVVSFIHDGVEEEASSEYSLICIGREPNTSGVGLERIGLNAEGFIEVNERNETRVKGVYAVGDVTGHPMTAYKAYAEGLTAADSICGLKPRFKRIYPLVVYSDPELAVVGLTLREAEERKMKVSKYTYPFRASGKSLIMSVDRGFLRILVSDGLVVGVEVAGPLASELISLGSTLVSLEISVEEAVKAIHPHPTVSEAFFEALSLASKSPLHLLGEA